MRRHEKRCPIKVCDPRPANPECENEKGRVAIDSPSLLKDFQCCTEPTTSFFIRLTSTRPPLVCFAMVPSAPAAGAFPMLVT